MEKVCVVYPHGSYVALYFRTGTRYAKILDRLNRYRPTSALFYTLYWDAHCKKPVDLNGYITPTSRKYVYVELP